MSDEKRTLYLRIDGEESGPFTVEDIKEKIDSDVFRRWDSIRTADKERWIRADHLVHLKALFEARNREAQKGSFQNWLDDVKTGKPAAMQLTTAGVEEEKKRLVDEREHLETERKRLEEEEEVLRGADEEREEEMRALIEERRRLEDDRRRIEEEEAELTAMGETVKKRRKMPVIVAIILAALVLVITVPSYIFLVYLPGLEAKEAARLMEESAARLSALEGEIADLEARLSKALDAGDIATATELEDELEEKRKEKEELTGEASEVPVETASGKATLGGLLSIDGEGEDDLTRSKGAIKNGISGQMGPVRSTYSKELKSNPGIAGQVIVGFAINSAGMVTRANVVSSTIASSAVESACVAAVRRASFGAAKGDTSGTFKFDFAPN